MSYLSNKLLYRIYKYTPLLISAMFIFFIINNIFENGKNANLLDLIVLSILSVLFFLLYSKFKEIIVEVEICERNIVIINKSLELNWTEITAVNFIWIGLYKLETQDQIFLFPPYDLPINVIGFKINTDEFDDLINKKKHDLNI